MNADELIEMIDGDESQALEFKESLSQTRRAIETLSAFSNANGGSVLFGVKKDKTIVGVQIGSNTLENLANRIKDHTDPPLYPSIEVIMIEDKEVIKLSIPESAVKPVFAYDHVYKRVGKTNQRLGSHDIRQLTRQSIGYSYTNQNSNASLDEIDDDSIKKFISKAQERRGGSIDFENTSEFLRKMNLLDEDNLSIAALLLFGKDPQRRYPQSEVKCGRFKGIEALDFEDMDVVDGTIGDAVDKAMVFVRRNLKMQVKFDGRPERVEIWEYPLTAIREGLINAICHRDYGLTSNVQVRIFDDRLEIWSPGNLPEGITPKTLKGDHESKPPNPLIAKPFFLAGYIENWGTGTNRMIRECTAQGLPEPDFKETDSSFIIIFMKDILTTKYLLNIGLNERQIKALERVKAQGEITNREYREMFGITDRTALNDLKEQCDKGILERVGTTGRDTKYILKKMKPEKPEINPK